MLLKEFKSRHVLETLKNVMVNLNQQKQLKSWSGKPFSNYCHLVGGLQSYKNYGQRMYSNSVNPENTLLNHLKKRIHMYGPLTVADYMKEVLTNPKCGYYMNRDVFGAAGDFITSPEISQMFGEMIGVWVVNEWTNLYKDTQFHVVELGPGRGTLADDMLRVFSQFPNICDKVSLHLVEVSPMLCAIQGAQLSGQSISEVTNMKDNFNTSGNCYLKLNSKYGPEVFWYRQLSDVPQNLSCFIAHEFLDALPIHKFCKTEKGWREVMIDFDSTKNSFRYVLAPSQTPSSIAYIQDDPNDARTMAEICPAAGLIVQEISSRISKNKGFALLADYGHSGEKSDTFRAFKKHKLFDPLEEPGTADLTADVDFSYLKKFTTNKVSVFGPITQESYLYNMGIGYRLQALLQNSPTEHWPSLISGYKMLTTPEQMGERFKFMAIMSKGNTDYIPAGFCSLNTDNNTCKH